MCTLISETVQTARKRHHCFHCEGRIIPGERYRRSFFADGPYVWSNSAHVECDDDARKAEGLYEPGECTDTTLRGWCLESGESIDKLSLHPLTVDRIRRVNERCQDRRQACLSELYASVYPEGRWADDGGRL